MFFFLNISPLYLWEGRGEPRSLFFLERLCFLFLFLGGKVEWDLGVFYGKMFKRLHFFFTSHLQLVVFFLLCTSGHLGYGV